MINVEETNYFEHHLTMNVYNFIIMREEFERETRSNSNYNAGKYNIVPVVCL